MDGVGISIIGRPRSLHNYDIPNAAHHTYTLKCDAPLTQTRGGILRAVNGDPSSSQKVSRTCES